MFCIMAGVDPQHQRAFERIYEYWQSEGRWPKLDDLQGRLRSEDEDVSCCGYMGHGPLSPRPAWKA